MEEQQRGYIVPVGGAEEKIGDVAILRRAVSRRLTPKQLHNVLGFFGFMGEVGRQLAEAPPR